MLYTLVSPSYQVQICAKFLEFSSQDSIYLVSLKTGWKTEYLIS